MRNLWFGKIWVVMGMVFGIGLVVVLFVCSYLSSCFVEIEVRVYGVMVNFIVVKYELCKGEFIIEENVVI